MLHHFITVSKLAKRLDDVLRDAQVVDCFSQEKDELIIAFLKRDKTTFYLRAAFAGQDGLLQFPDQFHRAKKNSVTLFADIIGNQVKSIYSLPLDRTLKIALTHDSHLDIQLFGRRNNVLLHTNGSIVSFKKNLVKQVNDTVEKNEHSITNSRFRQALGNDLIETYISPDENTFLQLSSYDQLIEKLANQPTYVSQSPPVFSLIPLSQGTAFPDIIEAVNTYYLAFVKYQSFLKKQHLKLQELKKKIKQTDLYLSKSTARLHELMYRKSYEETANLIMANMHLIQSGMKSIEVDDLYQSGRCIIQLKPELSASANAAIYYRKAKNEKQEVQRIEENIKIRQQELASMRELLVGIEKSIGEQSGSFKITATTQPKETKEISLPYHTFHFQSHEIWVGKNATANDQLTFKYAKKDDMWFHARDVSGSHVILRNPNKKPIPVNVIEHVAGIAAFFSKRKTEHLCPVSYTLRKYVRKIKNGLPGQVIMEREQVAIVPPIDPRL